MHKGTEGQTEIMCVSCMYVVLSRAVQEPSGVALLLEMVHDSVLSFLKASAWQTRVWPSEAG